MDFANRGSRPTQQLTQQPTQTVEPSLQPKNKSKKSMDFGKISAVVLLFTGTLLAVALIIGLIVNDGSSVSQSVEDERSLIKTDKYQALFLDSQDGQVYFGKLEVLNEDLYRLTDIYYVRVDQPIQPESSNQTAQPNISLAKLGNELHGPEDVMIVARGEVLYWENLKDDGQVVTAITNYKNGEQSDNQQSGNNDAAGGTEETQQDQ